MAVEYLCQAQPAAMAAPRNPRTDHQRRGSKPPLPPRLSPSASPSTMAGKQAPRPPSAANTSDSTKKGSPEPPRTKSWHCAVAVGEENESPEREGEGENPEKLLCSVVLGPAREWNGWRWPISTVREGLAFPVWCRARILSLSLIETKLKAIKILILFWR